MINNYWYKAQLKDYIKQFVGIFVGLHVQTGKNADGISAMIQVPISIGNRDRVVAAIQAAHTQNKPFSLPMMAVNMQGIELAPERRKGVGTIDRRQYLPAGGLFPEDLEVVYRLMPIPYNLNMELGIYASNTDQLHQILEQILLLFDPTVQIQKNDKALDWTRLTHVELTGINNEENYPMGQDKRIVQWSLNFTMPINLSAPMELRDNIIQEIILRIGNMNGFVVMEYDENGEQQSFSEGSLFSVSVINKDSG
jgi:hypothetical protein